MSEALNVKMPSLFLGHGSPMNAISKNDFTQFLAHHAAEVPRPQFILAVSAHWETEGTKVLKLEKPKTIHDFGGFPKELFEMQYPAPGSLEMADQITEVLKRHEAETSNQWGLDHGTWSVLTHLYPKADIPVLQLSLNKQKSLRDHLDVARDLRSLRKKGVLILGSGNIVHNLRRISWDETSPPADWAIEFDEYIKQSILHKDYAALTAQDSSRHSLWKMALPSLEHYLPLLYVMGSSEENENFNFPYEGIQNSSISMRAVQTAA